MPNVGYATLQIIPSMRGMQNNLATSALPASAAVGKKSGGRFSSAFGGALKKVGRAGLIGAGAAVGGAIFSGVKSGIDEQSFRAVMTGLYDDSEKARRTIAGINKAAAQSPLGFTAYHKAGESLAYMGIKGPAAITSLQNMNAAIVASGGSGQELQRATHGWLTAINKGKVQMDSLNQISDAGIPIYDSLAKHFGVTRSQLNEMVSDGKVGIKDLNETMRNAPGDLWAKDMTAAKKATGTFSNQMKILTGSVAHSIGEALIPLLKALTPIVKTLAEKLPPAIEFVSKLIKENAGVIKVLAAVVGTLTGAFLAWKAAMAVVTRAMKVMRAVQRALNLVMAANPILLVVAALAALAVGLIYAYKHSKKFRKIVNAAFGAVKKVMGAVVHWITHTFIPFFTHKIPNAFHTLIRKGRSLIEWFRRLPGRILRAIGSLAARLLRKGKALLRGFGSGIAQRWRQVASWLAGLGARAVRAVGNVASRLYGKGKSLVQGLIRGLSNAWSRISTWLANTGWRIVRGIGNLANTLWGVGRDVIRGLWDGMKSMWGTVTGWLSRLNPASWFNDINPYKHHAEKNLVPVGEAVFAGLRHGMENQWKRTQSWLSGLDPAAQFSVAAPVASHPGDRNRVRANGGNVYNFRVTVPVGASSADIGRELVRHIKSYERIGGLTA